MLEEETVDSTLEQEEVAEEVTEEESPSETIEEVKEKLAKAEEIAENQKIRAEKAEKKAKTAPKKENKTDDLSQKDVIFLSKTEIHEDDFDEVVETAKAKGITAKEAYDYMKPILDVRSEERTTADATQTKSPRGVKANTGEDLVKKAEKTGEVPEDEAGMKAMAEARMARRKADAGA